MPLIDTDKITNKNSPLSEDTLNQFLSFCERRKFPKKGIVFRDADEAESLFYILDGSVSVSCIDEGGNELVLAYLHKGEFIGEMGLFIENPERSALVRAKTSCELAEINYDDFDRLVKKELREQHAEILNVVGFQLSQRLLKISNRIHLLTSTDVAGRIARILLDLCHEPTSLSHPEGTQIHISRQEIGRLVSCSRETVGRVLKQMTEEGMIEVKGMDIVVYHSR